MYASRVFRLCGTLGVIGVLAVSSLADVVTVTNGQESVTLEVSSSLDLDLEEITAMTAADFGAWYTSYMEPELIYVDTLAQELLGKFEQIEESMDDVYIKIESSLQHGTIDADSRGRLEEALISCDDVFESVSIMYDDVTTITNLSGYLQGYYESAMAGYGSQLTVFYGGTLSVDPSPGGGTSCGCVDYLHTLVDICTNINATIAFNGGLITNLHNTVSRYGTYFYGQLNGILGELVDLDEYIRAMDENLVDIGFWDFDWFQLSDIDAWTWTAMDSIDSRFGLETTALRFATWIMSDHVSGVTNVVDSLGDRVPLLVEMTNTNDLHFPLAMAVTNAYDDTGHMIPLFVTETNNLTALTDMEARADAMTASDMEPSGVWERFPTGVDFDHVGSLPMSTFVEDSPPSSVMLFSGYQFGEQIIPSTAWTPGTEESRILRNIHTVTSSAWKFLGFALVVVPVFWWTFMLGFRCSAFVWSILDGRDAVKWFTDFLGPNKVLD